VKVLLKPVGIDGGGVMKVLVKLVGVDVGDVKNVLLKLVGADVGGVKVFVKPIDVDVGTVKNVLLKLVDVDVGTVKKVLLKLVPVDEDVDERLKNVFVNDVLVANVVGDVLGAPTLGVAAAELELAAVELADTAAPLSWNTCKLLMLQYASVKSNGLFCT
jgi:hypothetical protein